MDNFIPEVLQAVPGEGYSIFVYFNDGTVRKYDASRLVTQPGVFRKLQDMDTFRSCMTVLNGTVAWDLEGNCDETRCIDIDPFTVYDSPVVKDPLESMQTA